MADESSPWVTVGTIAGAVLVGMGYAFRRLLPGVTRGNSPSASPEASPPVTDAEKLTCYEAFVIGMRNRRMSFIVLQIVSLASRAISAEEIAKQGEALGDKEWAPSALSKVLKDLLDGGFIRPARTLQRHFVRSPTGQIIYNDCERWRSERPLASSEEDRLRCFDGILKFVKNSNTFYHVLKALNIAEQPMSAEEVFAKVRKLSGKNITLPGVQNLLDDLTSDPFVEKVEGTYIIHNNGKILLQCISNDG